MIKKIAAEIAALAIVLKLFLKRTLHFIGVSLCISGIIVGWGIFLWGGFVLLEQCWQWLQTAQWNPKPISYWFGEVQVRGKGIQLIIDWILNTIPQSLTLIVFGFVFANISDLFYQELDEYGRSFPF